MRLVVHAVLVQGVKDRLRDLRRGGHVLERQRPRRVDEAFYVLVESKGALMSDGTGNGGWNHDVFTVTPGIPGDSGSGYMDADGNAPDMSLHVLESANGYCLTSDSRVIR